MTQILGPVPCVTCRRSVWWDRVGEQLRLMEGRKQHLCPGDRLAKNQPGAKAA